MKILIAKYEVASFMKNLQKSLRANSLEADVFYARDHPFYETNNVNFLFNLYNKSTKFREETPRSKLIQKIFFVLVNKFLSFLTIFYIVVNYNVLVFTYATSITNSKLESFVYKLFNIKIFYVFLGNDVRPPFLSNKYLNALIGGELSSIENATSRMQSNIERIEREHAVVLSYLPYSQLLSKPFIELLQFGFPIENAEQPHQQINHVPRIIHIPSAKGVKRTDEIAKLFERLKNQYAGKIETDILYNLTNSEVLNELRKSDIIITELASDVATPIIALEACAENCVPIVCGQFAKFAKNYYQESELPPYPYVTKDELDETVENLLQCYQKILERKKLCLEYVRLKHDIALVGFKFAALFNDESSFKTVDPLKELYPLGSLYQDEFKVVSSIISRSEKLYCLPWVKRIFTVGRDYTN